jgi:PAS domain S-box-containing protein
MTAPTTKTLTDFPLLMEHLGSDKSLIVACYASTGKIEFASECVDCILGYTQAEVLADSCNIYSLAPERNAIYYRRHKDGSFVKFANTFWAKTAGGEIFTMDQVLQGNDKGDVALLLLTEHGEIVSCSDESLIQLQSSQLVGRTIQSLCELEHERTLDDALRAAARGTSCFSMYVKATVNERATELVLDFHQCVDNHVVACVSLPVPSILLTSNTEAPLSDIITDRRIRELRAEIEYLRDFRDYAAVPMFSVDGTGTVLWANDAYANMLGYIDNKKDLIGTKAGDVHIDKVRLGEMYVKVMRGEHLQNEQTQLKCVDGKIIDVLYNSNYRFNSEGQFVYSRCIVQDITHRKIWEVEKEQLESQRLEAEVNSKAALEASKMKSEFLAVMSHELRTPLNGVLGAASLLESTALTVDQAEYVSTISESADILLSLIHNILDITKIERGQIQLNSVSFRLTDSIRKCARIVSTRANAKELKFIITVLPPLDDPGRWHEGDPARLNQVLLNFLSNAVKFTEKGHIECRVSVVEGSHDGMCEEILLEVIDTGIGVKDEDKARLFSDFVQASSDTFQKYGGTGLGLSISRKLIALMDGTVGMESSGVDGEGTTVWARFPLRRDLKVKSPISLGVAKRAFDFGAHEEGPVGSNDISSVRILIAEDNKVNQKILRRMLEIAGFTGTVVAENGKKALEAIQEGWASGNRFDIILMDCLMPVMDGLEASRQIRAFESSMTGASHQTIILALTANATHEDEVACMESGMDAFFVKPVTREMLDMIVLHWVAKLPVFRKRQRGELDFQPIHV